ncbi:CPA2 family transporter [Candidatus Mancarchaeum acidiphilum]|uniref:CPA2 family transporter n=1 Tax=Candidatus Mancarchaeum acidiphilum TaxID=1920749 RepID=A0A218NM66_9ARCH|nr:cation:proton antiporter [Candidatus Mancarchaeum acidiphilum]ASI13552.1 CPA2 family transporter [Candidatus Mancarchaeum acidiphilum]
MEILIALLLLLAVSISLGKLLERFGITDIVGQIIAGMILGPSLLNIIQPSSLLSGIAEVAIFFILLFIGIEITTETLTNHIKSSIRFTLSSFIIPVILMCIVSIYLLNIPISESIIASVAIGVPSISIISVLIYRYSLIHTEGGLKILSAVIFTDIIAFVILAAVMQSSHLLLTVAGVMIFLLILLYIDRELRYHGRTIRPFFKKLLDNRKEDTIFALVLIMSLLVSAILQVIGITYVLGAVFAGMLIHKTTVGTRTTQMLKDTFRRLNDSFFIPIFFSIAGLEFRIPSSKYIILLVILVGISLLVGGVMNYFNAKRHIRNIPPSEVTGILGSRGAVGIVIASLAFQSSIINSQIYAIILVGTIVMSLIMPLLLSSGRAKRQVAGSSAEA